MTAEMYRWSKLVIHICMLFLLVAILIRVRQKKRTGVEINSLQSAVAAVGPEKTKGQKDPSPFILTGAQAIKIADDVRLLLTTFPALRVRIISTPTHMEFAKQLAGAVRSGGGALVIDDKRNEDVFLAQPEHNHIVLRFRDNGPTTSTFTYYTFRTTFEAAFRDQIYLVVDLFPKESTVNYFQIEIGGAL